MGEVSIIKVNKSIKAGLYDSLYLIGGIKKYFDSNDKVLLKPNINGLSLTTNIDLVESLIQLLFDYNIKSISIGESSFGNYQYTDAFFKDSGYLDLSKRYSIPLINFNKSKPIRIQVDKPLIIDSLEIAEEYFHFDKMINMPVMKVHYATGISLSLKNLKGLLSPRFKKYFHEVGLDKAIADLNNSIRPSLNIVDGLTCMEKMGPHDGELIDLNLIIAGQNSLEVDYISSKVMNYSINEIGHLNEYLMSNNIQKQHLDNIKILGEQIEDVRYNFAKVNLDSIIPKEFKIIKKNVCSACENAFLLSCKFIEDMNIPEANIYIGKLDSKDRDMQKLNIAFGNCCKADRKMIQIKGCPPYPFELADKIKEYLDKK